MAESRYRVGHAMSRRNALSLIGAAAFSLVPFDVTRAADANPRLSCVATPTQTEGPYFVDERLNRSDIRSDPSDGTVKDGVPLRLVLQVSQVTGGACSPLVGAQVDLWQCDALGVYSDVRDPGFISSGAKFLRG